MLASLGTPQIINVNSIPRYGNETRSVSLDTTHEANDYIPISDTEIRRLDMETSYVDVGYTKSIVRCVILRYET